MKKLLSVLLAVLMVISFAACGKEATNEEPETTKKVEETKPAPENPVIRLSTTTSVNDSGLLPYLQTEFEKDTGYKLEITSAGTGAAIEKARKGDADCLLVHAKASEEEFINEGFGIERVPFMYNYFVVVGPEKDPAGIKGSADAVEAFKKIAACEDAVFVSRGDNSGTHKAELKIWDKAEIDPNGKDFYVSTGQGMGASIIVAAEKQAYIMTDKGTYLSHEKKDSLSILIEESEALKNTYSMIAVNPEKWADTNIEGANAFIKWMQSEKADKLIAEYGVEKYGQPLFFVG